MDDPLHHQLQIFFFIEQSDFRSLDQFKRERKSSDTMLGLREFAELKEELV